MNNRAINRALDQTEAYLTSLVDLYVKYKATNANIVNGSVVLNAEYRMYLDALWKIYCGKNNRSSKRVIFLREEAFAERCINNLNNHKQMLWFARVREICLDKYGFEPNFNEVFSTYNQYSDPEDGAIHCVKNIPLDAHF